MKNFLVLISLLVATSTVSTSTTDSSNTSAASTTTTVPLATATSLTLQEPKPPETSILLRPPHSVPICYAPKSQVHDLMVQMNFAIQTLAVEEEELQKKRERLSIPRNQSTIHDPQQDHHYRVELCEPWRVAELEQDLRSVIRSAWQQHSNCAASPQEPQEHAQLRSQVQALVERLWKVQVFYGMHPQLTFDTYDEQVVELERVLLELSDSSAGTEGSTEGPTEVPEVPIVFDTTEAATPSTAPSMNDTEASALEASTAQSLNFTSEPFSTSESPPTSPTELLLPSVEFLNQTNSTEPSSAGPGPSSSPLTAPSPLAGLLWSYLNAKTSGEPPAYLIKALSNVTIKEASEAFQFAINATYPDCNGYDVFSSTRLDPLINRIDRLMFELSYNISMLPYGSLLDTVKSSPPPVCTQDYVRVAHKVYLRSLIDSDQRDQWMALRFRFNTGVFNLFSGRPCSLVTKSGLEVRPTDRRTSYDQNRHELQLEPYSHTTRRNQWRIHPVEQGRSFLFKSAYFDHRFFETAASYDWKSPGIYLHVLPEENSLQEFSRVFRFSIANSKWDSGVTRTGKSDVPFMSTRQLNALTVFELICVNKAVEHLPIPEYEPPIL